MFGRIHQTGLVEPSDPEVVVAIVVVVVGRLLIPDSKFFFVIDMFNFPFLHDSVQVSCILLGICPLFFLGYLICWHVIVNGSPFVSFYFCHISCKVSFFFIKLYLFGLPTLSFLVSITKGLSIFFVSSKSQLFISVIFFYIAFIVYFIYGFCDFYFLPPLTLHLVSSSFSSSLRFKDRLFILEFSYS